MSLLASLLSTNVILRVKPRLQEQVLCDKFYLAIFICFYVLSRLDKQSLCDKFYLFASVRPVYTTNFYLNRKQKIGDWDLWMTSK